MALSRSLKMMYVADVLGDEEPRTIQQIIVEVEKRFKIRMTNPQIWGGITALRQELRHHIIVTDQRSRLSTHRMSRDPADMRRYVQRTASEWDTSMRNTLDQVQLARGLSTNGPRELGEVSECLTEAIAAL